MHKWKDRFKHDILMPPISVRWRFQDWLTVFVRLEVCTTGNEVDDHLCWLMKRLKMWRSSYRDPQEKVSGNLHHRYKCFTLLQRAAKKLELRPYRISVVQELQQSDLVKRLQYCRWFRNEVGVLENVFFSDEAWFQLRGYVNSQNSRMWCSENPHIFHEKPLHPQKLGVWCAVSHWRVVGPIFFEATVNGDVYQDIITQFIALLDDDERYCWFQQDGATYHTSKWNYGVPLREFFADRIISKNMWPPRSPDLTSLDYFLWGQQKGVVYQTNLQT